jgi:large subunit ribosomal protein L16
MSLRPNKFKFKNRHKNRKVLNSRKENLLYGHFALRILQPLWVTGKQIFRYKIFLKKAVKRSDKTSRKIWFNLFPHLPLSKKIAGSRMGKGKGKLSGWVGQLSSGVNIFEIKNVRPGRATYFVNQIRYRLPVKSELCQSSTKFFFLPWQISKKITYEKFQ